MNVLRSVEYIQFNVSYAPKLAGLENPLYRNADWVNVKGAVRGAEKNTYIGVSGVFNSNVYIIYIRKSAV